MRIAQIMAGAPQGGAELFFERLCIALHEAGEDILPIVRRDAGRQARLRAAGLAPVALGFGGRFDLLTRPRLGRVLREAAPRVAVAWMGRAAAATPRGGWTLVGRLGGYYDLKRFRHCDHLVGNTRDIVAWLERQGVPAGKAHYLPNFVPDLLGATPADRAALGVPEGAKLVLAMGRLHPAKGFDVLIEALATLPDVYAVIAGEGPERAALERLAAARGLGARLLMPGWREDGGALLAACDVLVCPSRHEPLGNIVLEAWSAQCPVVATAAQGPAALIRAGINGSLVPAEDAVSLRRAIGAVLGDPVLAAGLAFNGRAAYLARFGEAAVVGAWRDFLHRVAA